MTLPRFFSIIIPVYNGGDQFKRCLTAISQSTFTDWELIIIDDGSTDGSARLAEQFGASVLKTTGRQGPAAARNLGARAATGRYLFFIDADCEVQPGTLATSAEILANDAGLDALFGSYDDAPAAPGFIAQYKNLFHRYIHQRSNEVASTFWTGCGVIKRSVFLALGGFDAQRFPRPSVEDIDLGYRLKQAGGRIRLARHIQVKHLKAWTLTGLLKSDILDRGIPWTRLILRDHAFMQDLNLQTHNRVSIVAIYGLLISLGATFFQPQVIVLALALAGLLLWLNWDLYRFFNKKRGLLFALKVIPMHWLYYTYNALSFGCGLALYWQERLKTKILPRPKPWADSMESEGN